MEESAMEYEKPYIIIRQSEKEDVITLSVGPTNPDIEDGQWGPFF